MNLNDSFFKKVEKKTKVDKNTILDLAKKLQDGNMKDENTLREVISTLSQMTGKVVTKEQEDKIISKVVGGKVPENIDKMFQCFYKIDNLLDNCLFFCYNMLQWCLWKKIYQK